MSEIKIKYPTAPGVYLIRNLINFKSYIGSTTNLQERISGHKNKLKKNKHNNRHLQNAANKYGLENFVFIVLDHYSKFPLVEIEMLLIKKYNSLNKIFGYNIAIPGCPPNQKGISKSKEHNLKNSLTKMGERNPNFGKSISQNAKEAIILSNHRRRKFYTFLDPNNNIITFTGLAKFCKENNLSTSAMSQVAVGKQKHHKQWKLPY